MPDYATLIDAETWNFIHQSTAAYPKDAVGSTIVEQRRAYGEMCKFFYAGRPEGITVQDVFAGDIPLRHYQNDGQGNNPMILFAHGGGFVVGGLDSHDDICAEICKITGYEVLAVDYRLAPENLHPSAFEDMQAAHGWARRNTAKPIILVGDSAGGNLVAALAHSTRDDTDILGQVLIYPGLGGDHDRGSYLTHANAPMLSRDEVIFYEGIRSNGDNPIGDATFAPLTDTSFSGLPPTVCICAECDPICDDGQEYCDYINAAGGSAVSIVEAGLVHGYLRGRHQVKRIKDSFVRINLAISTLGEGQPLREKTLLD